MTSRPGWDSQFAEDESERAERWRRTKAKRIAEGKCWQCVLPIEQCRCPNIRRGDGSKPFMPVAATETKSEPT